MEVAVAVAVEGVEVGVKEEKFIKQGKKQKAEIRHAKALIWIPSRKVLNCLKLKKKQRKRSKKKLRRKFNFFHKNLNQIKTW